MSAQRTTGFSLKRATIVSIALHLLAAAALVVTPQSAARSTGTGEGNSSEAVRVSTITIAFRPHAALAAAHASAPVRTVRAESAHTAATAVAATEPARYSREATKPVHAIAAQPVASRKSAKIVADTQAAPEAHSDRLDETTLTKSAGTTTAGGGATAAPVAPEQKLAVPVVAPVPSPSNAPAQAVALEESPARADVPSGGWGQSAKPLIADDDELAKLRASEHVSGTITIAVDDSGRATHVTLPASLASDVRDELEKKLLGMHYLPAECNGLRCVGTLQLTL